MPSRNLLGACLLALGLLMSQAASAQTPTDNLTVVMCGTSGPLPVPGRAKPCVAVLAAGSLYIIDNGPEAAENLQAWRMPLANARAVFVTHLHSDHIGGLGELNMLSWVAGRAQPLVVVGPDGTDKLAAGFNQAYEFDHRFRRDHHEKSEVTLPLAAGQLKAQVAKLPARPDARGVRSRQVWSRDGLTVTAIAVEHSPVTPAFAYRFDYKGRSVVVSGDTIKWPPLAAASKGADVLIHEAQNNDMTRMMVAGLKTLGNPRMASLMADTVTYHTSPVEAAELARDAGVKTLVLTHLTQAGLPFYTPQSFVKGIEATGFANWRLADDGMTITLPVGSDEVKFSRQ
jgi:ribonuclease Z